MHLVRPLPVSYSFFYPLLWFIFYRIPPAEFLAFVHVFFSAFFSSSHLDRFFFLVLLFKNSSPLLQPSFPSLGFFFFFFPFEF